MVEDLPQVPSNETNQPSQPVEPQVPVEGGGPPSQPLQPEQGEQVQPIESKSNTEAGQPWTHNQLLDSYVASKNLPPEEAAKLREQVGGMVGLRMLSGKPGEFSLDQAVKVVGLIVDAGLANVNLRDVQLPKGYKYMDKYNPWVTPPEKYPPLKAEPVYRAMTELIRGMSQGLDPLIPEGLDRHEFRTWIT